MASPEIDTARDIAERAHRDQIDKIGEPYIQHPQMVASLVQRLPWFRDAGERTQLDAVAAAWLHDVIEDTGETATSLKTAGISECVVAAVVALTRTDDVADDDYYANIDRQPLARLVKIADVASNLAPERVARLTDATRERLAARYAHALSQLHVDRSVITDLHAAAPGHA